MYSWTPPRGYKGLRTANRQAIRVLLRRPAASSGLKDRYIFQYAMEEWCEKRCKRNWSYVDGYWWFDRMADAVMFKLTFGGDVDS